jgi:excisionase family DNA binding protein
MKSKLTAAILRKYPDLLTVKNIQEILHISRTTAYTLLQSGELKSNKIRRSYRISKTCLLDYLNKNVS